MTTEATEPYQLTLDSILDEVRQPSPRYEASRSPAASLEALSDPELVERLLSPVNPAVDPAALLDSVQGLAGLCRTDSASLTSRLGPAGDQLNLAVELARRLQRSQIIERQLLSNPTEVANYLLLRYADQDQEVMGALYLDVRGRLIAEHEIFRGTLYRTAVEPRPILKKGILHSAMAILLFHTHPSGDPEPSPEDLTFTRRLAEAAEMVGIRLVDHLILGGAGQWVSLKRRKVW